MEAKELRIGNSVNHCGDYARITQIRPDGVDFRYIKNGQAWSDNVKRIDPIPITAEWLIAVGFILINTTYNINIDIPDRWEGFILQYSLNSGVWIHLYEEAETSLPQIKYVHQLQNLYFALTGEELKSPD